jgi:multidrug efflux pump subunit AcrA (membrane-fusion protein)
MVKRWAPALLIAAGVGCGRDRTAPVQAVAEPAAAPAASEREVALDAAAQRQGGIRVETAEVRSLPQALRASARVALNENRTWRVGAVTEGRIIRVLVNPGDSVEPGQVLARMHSHMIHELRAEYRKALAELARAKSNETYAVRARDRARRLYGLKAASLEQMEHAEAELKNSQTATGNAAIDVERARQHIVEVLEIAPDHLLHSGDTGEEHDEDLIPIKSPARGTVLVRNVTPGTVVQPAGELFVVSDLAGLWAIAAVKEEYLPRLRVGMPVRVYVQAYGSRGFPGRIGKLGDELDPTTRTVKVRVDVPNAGQLLKPEMYATAEIELGGSEPAMFIPAGAPQEVSGQMVVFIRGAGDRFEVRPVQLGRTIDGAQEVVSGLKAGEQVVTAGSFVLKSQLLKATLGEE